MSQFDWDFLAVLFSVAVGVATAFFFAPSLGCRKKDRRARYYVFSFASTLMVILYVTIPRQLSSGSGAPATVPSVGTRPVEEAPTASDALIALLQRPLPQRGGSVSGRPLPASPTLELEGANCSGARATVDVSLSHKYHSFQLQLALDDMSHEDSRVGVSALRDGVEVQSRTVERGQAAAMNIDVTGTDILQLQATSLSHRPGCQQGSVQLHLVEGVATT